MHLFMTVPYPRTDKIPGGKAPLLHCRRPQPEHLNLDENGCMMGSMEETGPGVLRAHGHQTGRENRHDHRTDPIPPLAGAGP